MTDNTVTIAGNLTRDPELRFTPSGQATATFGIAVNRTWTDRQSQERKESTSFFDVVAWGGLAENAATSLAKGARVVVTGRLDQRSWETRGRQALQGRDHGRRPGPEPALGHGAGHPQRAPPRPTRPRRRTKRPPEPLPWRRRGSARSSYAPGPGPRWTDVRAHVRSERYDGKTLPEVEPVV